MNGNRPVYVGGTKGKKSLRILRCLVLFQNFQEESHCVHAKRKDNIQNC